MIAVSNNTARGSWEKNTGTQKLGNSDLQISPIVWGIQNTEEYKCSGLDVWPENIQGDSQFLLVDEIRLCVSRKWVLSRVINCLSLKKCPNGTGQSVSTFVVEWSTVEHCKSEAWLHPLSNVNVNVYSLRHVLPDCFVLWFVCLFGCFWISCALGDSHCHTSSHAVILHVGSH